MSEQNADSGETPNLRTAAIAIWHYHQIAEGKAAWAATLETRAKQNRRLEQFRTELHGIIGERDDLSFRINGGCIEAEVEDLRFAALELTISKSPEPLMLVTLLARCPVCGTETMSKPVYNLVGVGKMLESFDPIKEHFCRSR